MCLVSIFHQSDATSDEMKREQMEKLVREELERWDSDNAVGGRGTSPTDSQVRSRGSRPGSSANQGGVSSSFLISRYM